MSLVAMMNILNRLFKADGDKKADDDGGDVDEEVSPGGGGVVCGVDVEHGELRGELSGMEGELTVGMLGGPLLAEANCIGNLLGAFIMNHERFQFAIIEVLEVDKLAFKVPGCLNHLRQPSGILGPLRRR